MKNKTREVILGIILAFPIVALIILFAIKTKMAFMEILYTFFAVFVGAAIALSAVTLALMLFHVIAYHFIKLALTFIRDYESIKSLPTASVKNEDTSMFISKAFIIIYCGLIYIMWNVLIGNIPY